MRQVRLKSIATNSGFLEQCKVTFAPSLTCIIGARGTCKSTVVESIRFAFDLDHERIRELTQGQGMIRKTLGAGSVRCLVEVEDDGQLVEYTIDRELDGAPRVLRDGVRDGSADDVLHDIEIYSQGALQQIASADKPQLRLRLIDRPNRTEILRIKQQLELNITELKHVGSRLRSIRGDIEKRQLELRDLSQLRAELGSTVDNRPALPPSLEEQHSLYVKRQQTMDVLNDAQMLQKKVVADLALTASSADRLATLHMRLEQLGPVGSSVATDQIAILAEAFKAIDQTKEVIEAIPLSEQATALASQFESDNQTYFELRQQQQVLTESLKREDAVRHRILELEKIERDLQQAETERNDLDRSRRSAREKVAHSRNLIFEMRVREAEIINRQFGDVVLLAVRRAAHSKPYIDRISELLAGSRIRTQGNIAEELATNLTPSDLLLVIEDGDAPRLANLLGRDLGQVTRIITYLRDHPDLYDLEGELFDDSLEITMFDRGHPKPVEQLSEGQRATALLPLILRS